MTPAVSPADIGPGRSPDRPSILRRLSPSVAGVLLPFAVAIVAVVAGPLVAVVVVAVPMTMIGVCRGPRDVVTVLTALLIVLFAIPARLVIGPVGGAGTPAGVIGLAAGWLWIAGAITPGIAFSRWRQPLRAVALIFLGVHMVSYVAANLRPLDVFESNAADRGLIVVLSGIGVLMLAVDGIPSRERLDVLLKRVVIGATAVAIVGILQFATGFDLAARVQVPGLENQIGDATFIHQRSTFRRVAGTSEHPIEFSVVLAMAFPLALHFATTAARERRRVWWACVGLLGVALPMSVSRTAVMGIAAAALTLVPTWSKVRRQRALYGIVLYAIVMRFLVPGLLGTIKAFFFSVGVDPSISARQGDYGYVGRFVSENPLVGRGYATFIPTRYDFIDNQYILSLVETGLAGLFSLIALLVVSMSLARGARRRSADPATRDLGQALAASLAVAVVTCATFDFLSFPTGRTLFLLLAGCAGALWRIERTRAPQREAALNA